MNNVLSISMRPNNLDDLLGLEDIVEVLKNQFSSGVIPHVFLITGKSGTGKTTISRIIANMLQNNTYLKKNRSIEEDEKVIDEDEKVVEEKVVEEKKIKYDIREINSADKNGIDDIRDEIEVLRTVPMKPSVSKVIIWDEAHQLTTPAQNALLKITEDTPKSSYIIFCTTEESKIIPTLRRRCYIINTKGIDKKSTLELINRVNLKYDSKKDESEINSFVDLLVSNEIDSPGLILQSAEKFFHGANMYQSVFATNNPLIDVKKVCNNVAKGNISEVYDLLKDVKKGDVISVRLCIMGYLRVILIKQNDLEKSQRVAKAILELGKMKYDDDVACFYSSICLACCHIKNMS